MRKLFFTFSFPILAIILGVYALIWWSDNSKPPKPEDSESYPFVIKPGAGASSVAKNLEEEGFIKSPLAFRFYVQVQSKADKIKAGDYRLSKNKTLPELVAELVRGPIAIWVTIPEGLRHEEIAQKLASGLGLTGNEKQTFLEGFVKLASPKEGFLFPDTYLFLKNTTPQKVIEKLNSTFESRVTDDILSSAKAQKLTTSELVTFASIVERETRTDEERPIVAGILLKRLRAGWALQADATLQYAKSTAQCLVTSASCNWWETVTTQDKTIKSPYNTYTNVGLPPAPIANPGLSSIKAVASPEDSPYWFYLHDNDGKIHYAETIEEHGENVREYLQ